VAPRLGMIRIVSNVSSNLTLVAPARRRFRLGPGWIGVILLGILIVSGYRNVMTLFRRDRNAGTIRLAYFVTALIFSFTEAGFRMMSVAWIAFLIATLAVPPGKRSKKHSGALAGNDLARPVPAESSAAYEDALEAI